MRVYSIEYKKTALKEMTKLPKNIAAAIDSVIYGLRVNPRPHGYIKLKGNNKLYRIRSGDYRIIYEIKNNVLVILIVTIGHRKDIYRLK